VGHDQQGLLPGVSLFRHSDPIEARWRRMIPAAQLRVLDDNGSAAR
jgi:hypothetical protein